MKKILLLVFVTFLSAGCVTTSPTKHTAIKKSVDNPYATSITMGNKKLLVQVVNTPKEMEEGLSGREKLTDEQGMLFDFKTPQPVSFWMKDMKFDLDFIWIANKKIVGITDNVPAPKNPGDALPTYSPPTDVDMVLEVNAGWSKKYGAKVGDEVTLK